MAIGTGTALAIAALTGAGATAYGANKQAKDNAAARDQNLQMHEESERQNWLRYLMTRGVYAGAGTRTGEIPGMRAGSAMNTKMPLWMNVMAPQRQRVLRLKGSV